MPNLRKINMVAGRGQTPINFTSLGIGRHSKSVYNIVNRKVFPSKSYPVAAPAAPAVPAVVDREIEKLWTKTLGTSLNDTSKGVAIDSNNNVYITGYTRGILDGNTNEGLDDAFLTKYDSNGTIIWTKTLGSDNYDYNQALAIDSNNNVYITGYTQGNFDGILTQGGSDAFLTKYDSNGNKQWTKTLGSASNDYSWAVAIDSNNYVYITGYTADDLDGNTNVNEGGWDVFLTKYDSADGTIIWTKIVDDNTSWDYSKGLAIDSNNNIYITGYTGGDLDGNTNQGSIDAFLTKYDINGDKKWTKLLGTSSYETSNAVAIDSNNNIYFTGYTGGDLDGNIGSNLGNADTYLTKYDTDGTNIWTKLLNTTSLEVSYGVATDSNNYVYITGYTRGNLDGNTNANEGTNDVFLTKYDTDGDKKWTKMLGSTLADDARGITIDSNNNVYITGNTAGDLDGNTQLGYGDAFLTKYG
jgi:hypothetical protein